jgi:phosphoribosylanthranilate isomerase
MDVDYVGFVFAPSRRRVTPEEAAALAAAARSVPMAGGRPPGLAGVFVNPTMEELERTLRVVSLDIVQFHGAETPDFCREAARRFGVAVWRALNAEEAAAENGEGGIADGDGPSAPKGRRLGPAKILEAYLGAADAVLIDTGRGGTGRTFRWEVIPAWKEAARRNGLRLFVAGGLAPDNVRALIDAHRPDGVDVSSGVETDGRKDIAKIAAFVERVKRG